MSCEDRPQPRHSGVHGRPGRPADRRSVQADAHGRGMARIIRWHQYGRGHVRRMRKGLVPSARRASAANQSVRGRVRRRNRLEGCFGGRRAHRGRHPLSDVGRIGAFARASTRPRAAFLLAVEPATRRMASGPILLDRQDPSCALAEPPCQEAERKSPASAPKEALPDAEKRNPPPIIAGTHGSVNSREGRR